MLGLEITLVIETAFITHCFSYWCWFNNAENGVVVKFMLNEAIAKPNVEKHA